LGDSERAANAAVQMFGDGFRSLSLSLS